MGKKLRKKVTFLVEKALTINVSYQSYSKNFSASRTNEKISMNTE